MAIEIPDLCKHGLAMRCPKCAYEIGFKAGQESKEDEINKLKIDAKLGHGLESAKLMEQARQEVLEEVEKTISNEIRARYDLYPNEEPPFNEIHLLENIFEALKKKEVKE